MHATILVTAPEDDGGIRCYTSLNQALDGSIIWKLLSATVSQKSAWLALPTDRHSPFLPFSARITNAETRDFMQV
jgi:hypothetical protein